MTRFVSGLLLSMSMIAVAAGCGGGSGDGESCTTSSDCASGRCVDGTCVAIPDGGAGCVDSDCDDGNPCNGAERCGAVSCEVGTNAPDGTACDADGDASTRDVCAGGTCAPARCGDTIVDPTTMEECDDGNDVDGDGCDGCRFSCTSDTGCDDGDECNGAETCNLAMHACVTGTPLADGADCAGSVGTCLAGSCVPKTCATAEECNDGNACTGAESCADMMCAAGTPLDCDDGIACTADSCAPATGCMHLLIDADRDGHPPSTLGECGDDCDDTNPLVYAGLADGCDGMDNDCDTRIDEDDATVWFADCDGDNFAPMGATSITACARPATSLTGCPMGGGAWVARAPTDAANADCNDANALVFPTQTMYQTMSIAGAPEESDFDYNCNGTEEPSVVTVAACAPLFTTCRPVSFGWVGPVPGCGETGSLLETCVRSGSGCIARGASRTQSCR